MADNSLDSGNKQVFNFSFEKFTQFFSLGSIRSIPLRNVPEVVKLQIENILGLLRAHEKPVSSFEIESPDRFGSPVRSYLLPHVDPGRKSGYRSVYMVDTIGRKVAGWSRLYFDPIDVMGDTEGYPTSARTESFDAIQEKGKERENFRKRGLARRRLEILNAFSQASFGLPLHSDIEQHPDITRIWVQLEREGRTHEINTPFGRKFGFNTPDDTIKK